VIFHQDFIATNLVDAPVKRYCNHAPSRNSAPDSNKSHCL
jgi:hypothetical protein